jgi:hypothetical protein
MGKTSGVAAIVDAVAMGLPRLPSNIGNSTYDFSPIPVFHSITSNSVSTFSMILNR